MKDRADVWDEARQVASLLRASQRKIVFAESCTAGLVCARLAAVPGISDFLCGSWVTYREASKIDWLHVPADLIRTHTAVSGEVARAMARHALMQTPEADLAAAITGHLGPHAPDLLDGVCFLTLAGRQAQGLRDLTEQRYLLTSVGRVARQEEAARWVLAAIHAWLRGGPTMASSTAGLES